MTRCVSTRQWDRPKSSVTTTFLPNRRRHPTPTRYAAVTAILFHIVLLSEAKRASAFLMRRCSRSPKRERRLIGRSEYPFRGTVGTDSGARESLHIGPVFLARGSGTTSYAVPTVPPPLISISAT